jgi:crossover junction endodeoxyribonuclease RuvC
MSIILGLDPGYDRLGFGVISVVKGKINVVDFGVITTDKSLKFGERLLQVSDDLEELLSIHKPGVVSVEKLYTTINQKTAMNVAEARGVARLVAAQHNIEFKEFTPNQIKSAVAGNGSADKKGIQKMVALILGLSRPPKPDDAADALAIALTAIGRQ